jgi:hypothetical protein
VKGLSHRERDGGGGGGGGRMKFFLMTKTKKKTTFVVFVNAVELCLDEMRNPHAPLVECPAIYSGWELLSRHYAISYASSLRKHYNIVSYWRAGYVACFLHATPSCELVSRHSSH